MGSQNRERNVPGWRTARHWPATSSCLT